MQQIKDGVAAALRKTAIGSKLDAEDLAFVADVAYAEMTGKTGAMKRLAADYGFTEQEWELATDPRLLRLLGDFARLRDAAPEKVKEWIDE